MTNTTPNPSRASARPSPTADRGVIGDILGFRPSATLGREMFALAVNVLLCVVLAVVVRPPWTVLVVGGVIIGVILVGRLAAGFATEGYAEQIRGAR